MPPLASKFEFYCASIVSCKIPLVWLYCACYCAFIVSSKRAFFEFIVPVIVPTIASKFEIYCASIVSSKRALVWLYCACYCASSSFKIRVLLCLLLCLLYHQISNFIVPLLCLVKEPFWIYCASYCVHYTIKFPILLCLYCVL